MERRPAVTGMGNSAAGVVSGRVAIGSDRHERPRLDRSQKRLLPLSFLEARHALAYYAQLFVVYMVGVLLAMALLSSLAHIIFPAFSIVNFVIYSALIYIAMGGIGFFLSVAIRYDWLTLAAIWLGSRVLRGVYGPKNDWRSKAVELLPPVHRLDDVANSLIGNGTAATSDVVWLLGYGLLFFGLGLLILRYGSLAD